MLSLANRLLAVASCIYPTDIRVVSIFSANLQKESKKVHFLKCWTIHGHVISGMQRIRSLLLLEFSETWNNAMCISLAFSLYLFTGRWETSSELTVKRPGWPAITLIWHLFFAQKETRCCRYSVARLQRSTGHSGRRGGEERQLCQQCFITLRIMAPSLISLPLWERKHSVSLSVINFLNSVSYELGWAVCKLRRLGAQAHWLIYNGGDVFAGLLSEAKGWTFSKHADCCVTLKEATTEMLKHCFQLKVVELFQLTYL